MRGAGSSGRGWRSASLVAVVPPVITAAAAVAAASLVSAGARTGVVWCGLAATVLVGVACAEAARRGRALAAFKERHAHRERELQARLARQEAEMLLLARVALPEAVARLQHGGVVEEVLRACEFHDDAVGADFRAARQAVLRSVLEAVDNEEALRESAQRAFVNIARRVQAIIHRQAQDLREMEDRHGHSPAVFTDLLQLDHGNALAGRLADSIAVLGGARPGRQWSKAVPLYSVLRGGMSRILDYQRVELHPVSDVAVVGPAVEPLIHALAELLDNATRYSPPSTKVHLTAAEVQSGIAVEIEDGGLSLSEEGRARAERMLRDAQAGIDLNDLGETPRLGLAVVGRLCQAYGFQVSLRPSAYGGVRAVLIVPQRYITTAPGTGLAHGIGAALGPRPMTGTRRRQAVAAGPSSAGSSFGGASSAGSSFGSSVVGRPVVPGPAFPPDLDDEVPVVTERAANGLPQRRRRSVAHRAASTGASGAVGASGSPAAAGTTSGTGTTGTGTTGTGSGGGGAAGGGEAVQPGLWLEAFNEGLNGRASSVGGAAGPVGSDECSGEGRS
ncbi:ATP-binding protein [Kitasatospora sp. NPDC004240]